MIVSKVRTLESACQMRVVLGNRPGLSTELATCQDRYIEEKQVKQSLRAWILPPVANLPASYVSISRVGEGINLVTLRRMLGARHRESDTGIAQSERMPGAMSDSGDEAVKSKHDENKMASQRERKELRMHLAIPRGLVKPSFTVSEYDVLNCLRGSHRFQPPSDVIASCGDCPLRCRLQILT